jgi:hypothetical protein
VLSSQAFATNITSEIYAPGITNIEEYSYIDSDGTFYSEATYLEDGVPSMITKTVHSDGSYVITAESGDYYEVFEGVYSDYVLPSVVQMSVASGEMTTMGANPMD